MNDKHLIKSASQIIAEVFHDHGDPLLFGYGRKISGDQKQVPTLPNAINQPPPKWMNGRRIAASISPAHREQHATAEQDLFLVNCRNTRRETWASFIPLNELFVLSGVFDPPDYWAEAVINDPHILPRRAVLDALRCNPSIDNQRAEKLKRQASKRIEPIRRLLHHFISLDPGLVLGMQRQNASEAWWEARRLVMQAIGDIFEQRLTTIVTIDIDGDGTEQGACDAMDIAGSITFDLHGLNVPAIIEPSRSRTGAYVRIPLKLGDIETEAFNNQLDAYCEVLATKYGTLQANGTAGICSVKGKLIEWVRNPEFFDGYANEPINARGWTRIERYQWRRHHATNQGSNPVAWSYKSKLDPLLLNGKIDQITAPGHGITRDPDGGRRRLADMQWLLTQRKNAPDAIQFFVLVGCSTSKANDTPKPQQFQSTRPVETPTQRVSKIDHAALHGPDGWLSYLAAGRIALRLCQGNEDRAAYMAREIREQAGVATGMTARDRYRRLRSLRKAVAYAARTYDPTRSGSGQGVTFCPDPEDVRIMQGILAARIPNYLIRFANQQRPDAKIDHEVLAVILVALQHAMHDNVGERGAAPRNFLLGATANYLGRNLHTTSISAAKELLTDARMIRVTRTARRGQCCQYILANDAPKIASVRALPSIQQVVEPTPPPPIFSPPPIDNNVQSVDSPYMQPGPRITVITPSSWPHIASSRAGPVTFLPL